MGENILTSNTVTNFITMEKNIHEIEPNSKKNWSNSLIVMDNESSIAKN